MKTKSLITRNFFTNQYQIMPYGLMKDLLTFFAKNGIVPDKGLKALYQLYKKDWILYDLSPKHLYNRALGLNLLANYLSKPLTEKISLIEHLVHSVDYSVLSVLPQSTKDHQQAYTQVFEKIIENYIASGWILQTDSREFKYDLINLPGALWVSLFPSLRINLERFDEFYIKSMLTMIHGVADPRYITQINNSLERFTKSATEELLSKE